MRYYHLLIRHHRVIYTTFDTLQIPQCDNFLALKFIYMINYTHQSEKLPFDLRSHVEHLLK